MKLAWLTDIHLNFLDLDERLGFYRKVKDTNPEAVLISGDIAEGNTLVPILREMHENLIVPIYFVLGNHDWWHLTDEIMEDLKELSQECTYMNQSIPIHLSNDAWLVGIDGWADGRCGDYENSRVRLWDSALIHALRDEGFVGKNNLLKKMQELADRDAELLKKQLLISLGNNPKKIIIITHIPPFAEASLYRGRQSGDDYLPFYASKATGDVLLEVAKGNLGVEFLVLCGHTHGECRYEKLPNLTVWVGGAEYGRPEVREIEV